MLNLKPMFKSLKEINKPQFKNEWNELDFKNINKALIKLFMYKVLKDHRGNIKKMYSLKDIENFFGLPYTSSSSYAMIGNTNTIYNIDIEETFNIELFAITKDNKIILVASNQKEDNKYFIIG